MLGPAKRARGSIHFAAAGLGRMRIAALIGVRRRLCARLCLWRSLCPRLRPGLGRLASVAVLRPVLPLTVSAVVNEVLETIMLNDFHHEQTP